jgi:hypothetical protein
MLKDIFSSDIVGTDCPRLFIKSIEHDYSDTKNLHLRVYYYVLDYVDSISWIDKSYIISNLKFNFKFKNLLNKNSDNLVMQKEISFFPIYQELFNNSLSNIPSTTINDKKYYIMMGNFSIKLENLTKTNPTEKEKYSIDMEFDSHISDLLMSKTNTLNISDINPIIYLDLDNDVFADQAIKKGDTIYSKYDLSKTLKDISVRNTLHKDLSVLTVPPYAAKPVPSDSNGFVPLFKVTQSGNGNTKGIFVIDYKKIALEKIFLFKLYNATPIIEKVLNSLPIKVSIIRNYVNQKIKNISTLDKQYADRETIATYDFNKNIDGSIKEISGVRGFFNNSIKNAYKSFTFNDKKIIDKRDGYYFYTVEISILDTSLEIYNSFFIKELENCISILKEYHKDITSYLLDVRNGFIKDEFYNDLFLTKYKTDKYNLAKTIEVISKLYLLLYGNEEKIKNFCFASLNPLSCNVNDVSRLIKFVEDKIHNPLNGFNNLSVSVGSQNITTSNSKEEIKLSLDFTSEDKIIEKNSKEIGYDFISIVPSESISDFEDLSFGLNEYSVRSLLDRTYREMQKYVTTNTDIYKTLNTLSPAQIFANKEKSLDIFNNNLITEDYNNYSAYLLGIYENIDKNFNKYQSEFYQLMKYGIYLKNITNRVRETDDYLNKDILFDSHQDSKNSSIQYITDTGIYDFYNEFRSLEIAPFISNLAQSSLTGTFQVSCLNGTNTSSKYVLDKIDGNSFSRLLLNYSDLTEIKYYNGNSGSIISNIENDFSSSNFKYTICETNPISSNPIIQNKKLYNRFFLVSNNANQDNFVSQESEYFPTSVSSSIYNEFYNYSTKPEYLVMNIEEAKEEKVLNNTYYLDQEYRQKKINIMKSI